MLESYTGRVESSRVLPGTERRVMTSCLVEAAPAARCRQSYPCSADRRYLVRSNIIIIITIIIIFVNPLMGMHIKTAKQQQHSDWYTGR